jgi:hypothetical protein
VDTPSQRQRTTVAATKSDCITDIKKGKQSSACLPFGISNMLVTVFIPDGSCFENIHVLECSGKDDVISELPLSVPSCLLCSFSSPLLLSSCTDSFAKLNCQSERFLSPTAPTPIQHAESGELPPPAWCVMAYKS